jgi:hypothetical protein
VLIIYILVLYKLRLDVIRSFLNNFTSVKLTILLHREKTLPPETIEFVVPFP